MINYKYTLKLGSLIEQQRKGKIDLKILGIKIIERLQKYKDDPELDEVIEALENIQIAEDYDEAINKLYDWGDRQIGESYNDKQCWIQTRDIKVSDEKEQKPIEVLGIEKKGIDYDWFTLNLQGKTITSSDDNTTFEVDDEQKKTVAYLKRVREHYYGKKYSWVIKVRIVGTEETISNLLYGIGKALPDKQVEPRWEDKKDF